MSDNIDFLDTKTQQKFKPKIEEIIPLILSGSMEQSARDFVAYMRNNRMAPAYRPSLRYKCNYKGKGICVISFPRKPDYGTSGIDNEFDQSWMSKEDVRKQKNNWIIIPHLYHINEYEDSIDDEMKKIIWNTKNIYFCNGCWPTQTNYPNPRESCGSRPVRSIFGKEFSNLCERGFFWFFNPSETEIDCIKRLLILEKQTRNE